MDTQRWPTLMLRDVRSLHGVTCYGCHGQGTTDFQVAMDAVADPTRQPWASEPRCSDCHHRRGSEYEQAGTLFRNSVGHGGVFCEACHNSTHALIPARDWQDNVQSVPTQGYPGPVRRCTACHGVPPSRPFVHRYVPKPSL